MLCEASLRLYNDVHTLNEAKSQLTKANQTKTKMESLARELQKVRANICGSFSYFNPYLRTTRSCGWVPFQGDAVMRILMFV